MRYRLCYETQLARLAARLLFASHAAAGSSGSSAPHLRVDDLNLPDAQRRLCFLPLLCEHVCQALRPHLAQWPPSLRLRSIPPEQGEVDVAIGQVRLEGDGPEDVYVDLRQCGCVSEGPARLDGHEGAAERGGRCRARSSPRNQCYGNAA